MSLPSRVDFEHDAYLRSFKLSPDIQSYVGIASRGVLHQAGTSSVHFTPSEQAGLNLNAMKARICDTIPEIEVDDIRIVFLLDGRAESTIRWSRKDANLPPPPPRLRDQIRNRVIQRIPIPAMVRRFIRRAVTYGESDSCGSTCECAANLCTTSINATSEYVDGSGVTLRGVVKFALSYAQRIASRHGMKDFECVLFRDLILVRQVQSPVPAQP